MKVGGVLHAVSRSSGSGFSPEAIHFLSSTHSSVLSDNTLSRGELLLGRCSSPCGSLYLPRLPLAHVGGGGSSLV